MRNILVTDHLTWRTISPKGKADYPEPPCGTRGFSPTYLATAPLIYDT